MAKKRKLTKEEKIEIKTRESLGRLCKPGCALVVFGREISAEERLRYYEDGIRIMFTNDVSEVTELLENAASMNVPLTLIVRTNFSESPHYFASNIEPLFMYLGENIDVKVYGHTPFDHVLDRMNIRTNDVDDRTFLELLARWSPYCTDVLGYGNRMKVLARNEKIAFEKFEKPIIKQDDFMTMPLDPFEVMEKLSACAEDFNATNESLVVK